MDIAPLSLELGTAPTKSVDPAPSKREAKPAYPPPAWVPTQIGPEGIPFDFNRGARLFLPPRRSGLWRARLRDLDTGNVLFESEGRGGTLVNSAKRWFVRFRVEVWSLDDGPDGPARPVFAHDYDACGREVLIQFPVGTLGDILAWFPYAARFAERHDCRLTCALSGLIIPLLQDAYPELCLVTHEQVAAEDLAERAYATGNPPAAATCPGPRR